VIQLDDYTTKLSSLKDTIILAGDSL
jgi:hypothetical protein